MEKKKIIMAILVCLGVVGLSFFGGVKYGQGKNNINQTLDRQNGFSQNGTVGGNTQRGNFRGGTNGGLVSGEIIAKDDKSLTVKLRDGGSKIVFFSPSTQVDKAVVGKITDIVIGNQVTIIGAANPDGSVNATSIQSKLAQNAPIVAPVSNQ